MTPPDTDTEDKDRASLAERLHNVSQEVDEESAFAAWLEDELRAIDA